MEESLQIISFGNTDKKKLKRFVDFHWTLYKDDPQYIPLLDYEYLGFRLIGMTGFFEPKNPFFEHAEIQFFLAEKNNKIVGRCYAFINYNHNKHWDDRTGFFGGFESVNDPIVAKSLLQHAEEWLKNKGMDTIRGPQHLPVNEATPGCLVDGFDSRPVLYYHYNKPYYADLLKQTGLEKVKGILSWEIPVMNEMEDKLKRVAEKVIDRFDLTFEHWDERPLSIRKQEMLEIYNDAWSDNFGFVPFTRKEFYAIVNDMMLIMEKNLFMFIYVNGEPAAFFGGVLNVAERMVPIKWCAHCELLRALKMLLTKKKCKGFRLGYLGVKKKYRRLGLDGVMIYKQKQYTQSAGYEYSDVGWILDDNKMVIRLAEKLMNGEKSKEYAVFEKPIKNLA